MGTEEAAGAGGGEGVRDEESSLTAEPALKPGKRASATGMTTSAHVLDSWNLVSVFAADMEWKFEYKCLASRNKWLQGGRV